MPLPEAIGRFLDDDFVGRYVKEVREALQDRSASTALAGKSGTL